MSPGVSHDDPNDDSMVYQELSSVEEKCEQYVQAYRAGDAPPVEEFAAENSEFESQILELLPTVMMMEDARERNLGQRKDGRVNRGPDKIPDLGEFRIVRELGRGGMGIVYEAHQESLDRRVAIKVLPKHALKLNQIAKFCQEAATAAKLHHTNIAPVYGVGESNGYHFYAMQLLDGVSLERYVKKADDEHPLIELRPREPAAVELKPLTVGAVVQIGRQVASALSYAHEQGVIHRDIKPSNLILDGQSTVWVTDFGLAVSLGRKELRSNKGVSGTLRYMAPEKFSGAGDAPTEDIYSLGISLIELLSGRPAFNALRPKELTADIKAGKIGKLSHEGRELPRDLEAVLRKAVALNPGDRYQSAEALADDLQNFSDGLPVQARPLSMAGKSWRWIKRNPALTAASALAVSMLVAASIVSTVSYFRIENALTAERTQRVRAESASSVASRAMDQILNQFSTGSSLYDRPAESGSMRPRLTSESAVMLKQLSEFYLQLASQNHDDAELPIKALSARCRVGEINKRLGRYEESADAFRIALSGFNNLLVKEKIPYSVENVVLVAHLGNQLGVVKSIAGDDENATLEHEKCIQILADKNAQSESEGQSVDERLLLELARSHYFAGYRTRPGMGPNSLPPPVSSSSESETFTSTRPDPNSRRARQTSLESAIKILNSFEPDPSHDPIQTTDQSESHESSVEIAAARAHLLALCYRELTNDDWTQRSRTDRDRHFQSIDLLESLVEQYPEDAVFKFELMKTLSEINIFDPFLKQESSQTAVDEAYESLQRAVTYANELSLAQPDIANYRIELIHSNFKLGSICHLKSRFASGDVLTELLAEQEQWLRKAMMGQLVLVQQYPRSFAYKVWLARFSLSLAACESMNDRAENRNRLIGQAIAILNRLPAEVLDEPRVNAIMSEAELMSRQSLIEPELTTETRSKKEN